jgi:hypothetical protein
MRKSLFCAVSLGALLCLINFAKAATAVYEPLNGDGALSVQGFNGPFDLQVVQSVPVSGVVAGAAASNATLYGLFTPSTSTTTSVITLNNAQTGAYESSLTINTPLSDIAYTNGQLYGLQVNSTSIQVDAISNSGALTPVVTQSASTPSGTTWRLSGAVNGDSLLATALPTFTAPTVAYSIDPAAAQVSPFAYGAGPAGSSINVDTVMNLAGNVVTLDAVGPQSQYSYPSGTFQDQVSPPGIYPGGISSDEFTYNYPASDPAYVGFQISSVTSNGYDNLFRSLPNISFQTQLENGIAPDGTTLSSVTVAAGQQIISQQGGPSPLQITETDAAPGTFSYRTVATDTISLNPGAAQGIYSYGITPNALTANYTYGNTTDVNRLISYEAGPFTFAYDPISSNIVGNGEFSLGTAGWEADTNYSFNPNEFLNESVDIYNDQAILSPTSSSPYALRQFLQLPTAGSPMVLSFDYDLLGNSPGPGLTLDAYLGSTLVGTFAADTAGTEFYQTTITNPALENLNGTYLTFVANSPVSEDVIGLTDISLTAVPEPTSLGVFFFGLALARRPHRRLRTS